MSQRKPRINATARLAEAKAAADQGFAAVRDLEKRQTASDNAELRRLIEAQLHLAKTPQERAAILEELTRAVYDHIKTWVVGGEGLDNRDGPERRAAAKCLDTALNYSAVAAGLE